MAGRDPAPPVLADLDAGVLLAALRTVRLGRSGLQIVGSTPSTSTVLAERARQGAAGEGAVLIADAQTSGRGRGDHRWESPPGQGLYLSVLLSAELPPERLGLLTLACGVAVCELCEEQGVRPHLRWPNDVLVGERKLAGILCELVLPLGSGLQDQALVVAGIGLNVGLDPQQLPRELKELTTSLAHQRGEAGLLRRDRLAARLLDLLERATGSCATDPAGLLAAWEQRWPHRGLRVRITDGPPGIESGRAVGVADSGALLLDVPGHPGVVHLLSGSARPC